MSFSKWLKGYFEAIAGAAMVAIGFVMLLVSAISLNPPIILVAIFLIVIGLFAYLHGKYNAEANSPKGVYKLN